MDNENGKCYDCSSFQRFYTKGRKKFNRIKLGRCCIKDKIVGSCEGCEKWRKRRIYDDMPFAVKIVIDELLLNVKALRQIVEEYNEDNENLR